MLSRLPASLRGALTAMILSLNTAVIALSLVPPALIKLLLPAKAVRRACDRVMNALASRWVGNNSAWIAAVQPAAVCDVQGVDGLHARGWYLVSSNHQSWVDILVLQRIFHGHIPFLKFFLKQELIWVPVIGLAWWALDFPFMKRGEGSGARQNDLKTTREACEKFKLIPTTVINFVEGTRFTLAKQAAQQSPYRHLLKPKIGGLGIALAAMGEQFEALLDVTLPAGHADLLAAAVRADRRCDGTRTAARDPGRGAGQRPVARQGLPPAHRRVGRRAVERQGPADRCIAEIGCGRPVMTAAPKLAYTTGGSIRLIEPLGRCSTVAALDRFGQVAYFAQNRLNNGE
jgi:1-acyl-sn-glycerol-3-phosphate acyltransferase